MVASKTLLVLFLIFRMEVVLMTKYKGNQEMYFWICTNKDVIQAVTLLLLLLQRVVFITENVSISNIFVFSRVTYVTKVDYKHKIIHFFLVSSSYPNFHTDLFISSLAVEDDFLNILTWQRSTGDSALLKEIFRMKLAVECFTNVVQ